MTRNQAIQILVSLATLLLTGCVTLYDNRYPSAEGWRYAWVHTVGTAEEVSSVTLKQCLSEAHATDTGKYVKVWFRNGSGSRSIAVPLPAEVQVSKGETVYVNLETCALRRG
jgi:hypothetical protein